MHSIGITDQSENPDDEKAMQSFREKRKFQNGRYQVTWSWKQNDPVLPVSRSLAFGKLKSCIGRMKKKTELLKQYDAYKNN